MIARGHADASKLLSDLEALKTLMLPAGQNPMEMALVAMGVEYMAFVRERFKEYSNHGGDWPEHRPETIKRRSAKIRSGESPILVGASGRPHSGAGLFSGGTKQYGFLEDKFTSGNDPFPLLIETGELYDSLVKGHSNYVENILSDGIEVGTSVPYAFDMQNGMNSPPTPPRPFIVPPDTATIDVMRDRLVVGVQATLAEMQSNGLSAMDPSHTDSDDDFGGSGFSGGGTSGGIGGAAPGSFSGYTEGDLSLSEEPPTPPPGWFEE